MATFRFDFGLSSDQESNNQHDTSSEKMMNKVNDSSVAMDTDESSGPSNPLVFVEDIRALLLNRFSQQVQYDTLSFTNESGNSGTSLPSPLLRVRGSNSEKDVNTSAATATVKNIVKDLEQKQTDILPGVYEGGLKLWECSVDLCRYLAKNLSVGGSVLTRGGYVLELGCGQGLPGCFLLREGLLRRSQSIQNQPFSVIFADYNEFVLRDVTLSNIMLNTLEPSRCNEEDVQKVADHAVLAGGDWMDLSQQLQAGSSTQQSKSISLPKCALPTNGRFNVILAAETTYTDKSSQETAILMARHLAVDMGIGLVATKRYYFGVGGGSDAFRSAAASQRILIADNEQSGKMLEYGLSVETLEVYDSGAGNIRELLGARLICK